MSTLRVPRTRTKLLTLACAATLLAGCGSDDAAPETGGGATTQASESTSQEVTIPVTPTTTTLVDAGAEPTRTLRYDTDDTDPQNVDLVTTSTVLQQINDAAQQDFSTPELTLPLTASTSRTDAQEGTEATRSVDLVIGSATSPDGRLTDALAASNGSSARITTEDSGAVTALHIAPAEAALDTARSAVERSLNSAVYRSVDFPEDAVGVGAIWTIDQQVLSGITLNQRTTVTVRAIDGDRVTLDIVIAQTPESTVWNLPDDAGSLNIASYEFAGNGTLDVDLTQPLPTGGSITAGGDQAYTDPDSTTVLRQTSGDSITWRTR